MEYQLSNPTICGMNRLISRVEYLEQVGQGSDPLSLMEQVEDLRRTVDALFHHLGDHEFLSALLAVWDLRAPDSHSDVESQHLKANYNSLLTFAERIEAAPGLDILDVRPHLEPTPRAEIFREFDALTIRSASLCSQWVQQLALENGSLALAQHRLARRKRLESNLKS